MTEYEFSSDAARIQYAEDKVRQYGDMVNCDASSSYHWERTDPNGSKLTHELTPIETQHLANRAAFYLSQELNSVGIIYRGIPAQKEQEHE